ncbi:MAG: hypothetical protein U5L02_18885 [Rheinheimera sp.]|nr:hypothetical protein [Rheinheimera sp.]
MFRSNKFVSVLGLYLGVVAPLSAAEFWLVKVAFDANGSEIQQVQRVQIPDRQRRTSQLSQAGAVTISLKNADGKVLQQVSMDDPRIIRVPMLPGSAQGHQFVVRDKGDFMLVLPAQPDASLLQLQWAETPGQPVKASSPQQQLSLQQFAAELQLK